MSTTAYVLFLLGSLSSAVDALSPFSATAQGVNTWLRAHNAQSKSTSDALHQRVFSRPLETIPFQELYYKQPLDHFNVDGNAGYGVTFGQRYWVNNRHYVEGGPVFLLDGGETSGTDRLPFLDHGVIDILAEATNGLGIVLEHRYYGESIPVKDFSTDSLRWLNNAQSLEDSAQFMANFKWNNTDLSARKTKWIYYGGSYAGARAAHMRVLYPDLVYGAIASSGVTHAAIDYWEYMDAIRTTANQTCTGLLTDAVAHIDRLLSNKILNPGLKALFKLRGLSDADFASVISEPLGSVQSQNWDPKEGSDYWSRFCDTLVSGKANSKFPIVRSRAVVLNYAKWIREEKVEKEDCVGKVEECYGTDDATKFQDVKELNSWRAWTWQVCNEWGYFVGAPPDNDTPTIVSRRLTLDYTSKICRQAFPAGKHAQVPEWPDVSIVNKLGDFNLAVDRLAFIDGDEDPWQHATPHSRDAADRPDTLTRPFKMIKTGVHHHDQNGLRNHTLEPAHIRKIHAQEVEFVKAWLSDASSPSHD